MTVVPTDRTLAEYGAGRGAWPRRARTGCVMLLLTAAVLSGCTSGSHPHAAAASWAAMNKVVVPQRAISAYLADLRMGYPDAADGRAPNDDGTLTGLGEGTCTGWQSGDSLWDTVRSVAYTNGAQNGASQTAFNDAYAYADAQVSSAVRNLCPFYRGANSNIPSPSTIGSPYRKLGQSYSWFDGMTAQVTDVSVTRHPDPRLKVTVELSNPNTADGDVKSYVFAYVGAESIAADSAVMFSTPDGDAPLLRPGDHPTVTLWMDACASLPTTTSTVTVGVSFDGHRYAQYTDLPVKGLSTVTVDRSSDVVCG